MDYKSYLLDFKSLSNEDVESNISGISVNILDSVPTPIISGAAATNAKSTGHHTMEFFEMCAALIIQLAR